LSASYFILSSFIYLQYSQNFGVASDIEFIFLCALFFVQLT
jgi:hypothetical protein